MNSTTQPSSNFELVTPRVEFVDSLRREVLALHRTQHMHTKPVTAGILDTEASLNQKQRWFLAPQFALVGMMMACLVLAVGLSTRMRMQNEIGLGLVQESETELRGTSADMATETFVTESGGEKMLVLDDFSELEAEFLMFEEDLAGVDDESLYVSEL